MGIWRKKNIKDLLEGDKGKFKFKKTLGALDLTALGIGAIIGTGIFVLTGVAAAKYAGPGIMISFIVAAVASGLAALVYAELASAIPVAGSAYTYSYASLGEFAAWLIGWNLILEYVVAAGAVAIGWSAYFVNILRTVGITLPASITSAPFDGGAVNLFAVLIVLAITGLLILGTQESVTLNKIVVVIKIAVVLLFLAIGIFYVKPMNWKPFTPYGVSGIMRGAAIIFFAYIGFDAVSTAAEEVKKPQRDLPIGIIASLIVSTLLYVGVSAVLTGMVPYQGLNTAAPVSYALLSVGIRWASAFTAVGALAGLTSVLLVSLYGQSRVFFAMGRDGLLPEAFTKLHPEYKTPYIITTITGLIVALIAGFLPISLVAEMANIGTLSAFVIVSIGVLVLRKTQPDLERPFRVPLSPFLPIASILFSLFLILNLPVLTWVRFVVWVTIGTIIYFIYGYNHSHLAAADVNGPKRTGLTTKILPAYKKKIYNNNDEKGEIHE